LIPKLTKFLLLSVVVQLSETSLGSISKYLTFSLHCKLQEENVVVSFSTIPTAGIESEEEAIDNDGDYTPPDPHQKKSAEELVLHLKQPEWMDAVFAAADRGDVSTPNLLSEVLKEGGVDLNDATFSVPTLSRRRTEKRLILFQTIKEKIKFYKFLGLHFDGKQFRQWLDMLKTENIAVGVSGGKRSKFLGILPCASANASDITEQIREIVAEWGLWDNIFFMCYDTANTNSGEFTGTIKT
jgi:hypothetical protein